MTGVGSLHVPPSASSGVVPDRPWSVDPRLAGASIAWPLANRAYYYRVSKGGTISAVGLYVTAAAGNICVGFYSNNGLEGIDAEPDARIGTSGSVACPAAGAFAEVALTATITVADGDWIAISTDGGQSIAGFDATGAGSGPHGHGVSGFENAAFPLPATATMSPYVDRIFALRGT